ncbi:hypothetical protein [uncultured Gimesia sp.]|uniref:hypothetical protein n=1 Tax=uncultured Gimesia sp. TaxID=1678688 RepID=UPI0030D8EAF9
MTDFVGFSETVLRKMDELDFPSSEEEFHIRVLYATILHLLGFGSTNTITLEMRV